MRILLCTILLFAACAPAALWLRHSYVPIEEPKGTLYRMVSFYKAPHGFAYVSRTDNPKALADTPSEPRRSPIVIYEDGKALGPSHSPREDVERIGLGRFSHLRDVGYVLSTSDNSDPNTNGRNYWVVLPKAGDPS
jgi:hypothetical protein